VGALGRVFLFGPLTKRLGEVKLIRYAFILSGVIVVLTTMAESYINILLATIFVFIGFDLMRPAVTSYLSKVAGNDEVFVRGMNSVFTSFGSMFWPVLGVDE